MTGPLVRLAIRKKTFGHLHVLEGIEFAVQRGEVVSLVGPSGCGKSTILRIIAGFECDYRGEISVLGHAPRLGSAEVGFIFQEPRLLPWLSVADNVGFVFGRRGGSHPVVAGLLAEVGLSDFAGAYPKQLSGGMAQRAAIARGLCTNPDLLLLDEPFSAVDALTRMRLQDMLLSVARRHETTLLLVTHDLAEAAYLSDRIVVLSSQPGRIMGEVAAANSSERYGLEAARCEAQVLNLLEGKHVSAKPRVAGGR